MKNSMDDNRFVVRKENIVMIGTTDETMGRVPFIVYSGKGDSLFVSTMYRSLENDGYSCRYDTTRRLCNSSEELRIMRVEDIERKALVTYQSRKE